MNRRTDGPTDRRTGWRNRAIGALVIAASCSATPLAAQAISGGAIGYSVTRRLSFSGTVHEQTGTWMGVEGGARLGSVTIGASGLFGKVSGDPDTTTNPDLDMRVSDAWLRVRVAPWLDLGIEGEARRQEAKTGVTTWRLIGGTARATPPLGVSGLTGLAEVTYFASASDVGSSASISPALRATMGVSFSPSPGRVELRLAYRFERYDFSASGTGPARLEQFSGIMAGAAVRLGRGF